MKVFNKPERAAELGLSILELNTDNAIICLNTKYIPADKNIEDIMDIIKKEDIIILDT